METQPTSDQTRYQPAPNIIATDLEQELVLLDPMTREMFSLNETGRLVWQRLPASLPSLARQIAAEFDVGEEEARQDVGDLLQALRAAALIEPVPDAR